jgi:hypothetical protein
MSKKGVELPQKEKMSLDGNYPGLNGLSYWIGYLEQFLAILSEPLLIACAALAVVDFMTGGRLLALPILNYTWAGSLAMAVTACFIVTWRRAMKAFTLNRYGVSIGLAFLGLLLGIVDFAAIAVQALQQTLNISFAQALALLNLNVVAITYTRAAVTIAMAVVVALTNHTAVTTAQAPKRRLAFFEKALNKFAPVVSDATAQPAQAVITPDAEQQEVKPIASNQSTRLSIVESHPTLSRVEQAMLDAMMKHPKEALELQRLSREQSLDDFTATLKQRYSHYAHYITPERVTHVMQCLDREKIHHDENIQPLERVRLALNAEPGCSDRRLGRVSGMSAATAKKYRLLIEQDRTQVMREQ